MKLSVVCLTRGYQNEKLYSKLIDRTKKIVEILVNYDYDLILFHEGNINQMHQEYIQTEISKKIKFIHVDFSFPFDYRVPQETMTTFENRTCYPGYHRMCEFNFCDMWSYLTDYDIVFRIDEDCLLDNKNWKENIEDFINSDEVFRCISYNKNEIDSHELTNNTFPHFLNTFWGKSENIYKSLPTTHLYITKMSFWKNPEVVRFLISVKTSQGCLKFRWGDHVLIDSVLNLYSNDKIGLFKDVSYFHGSHNKIMNPDEKWSDCRPI